MPKGMFCVPQALNEPLSEYLPKSTERSNLQAMYDQMYEQFVEIPQYIGDEEIFSGQKREIRPPHDHKKLLGYWHEGNQKDVSRAIEIALKAKAEWEALSWEHRASIFLKAADLISGPYRAKINAATMIAQSKNAFQAEIDAACELIDFLRFNVAYMQKIYTEQPLSSKGVWNRMEYRPLEGFVFAITPFNFTAIAANLPICMAMMGNVVIWKPSDKQVYSAQVLMELFKKAGLPSGVINMVLTEGAATSQTIFEHPDFSGVHFTGSTEVFRSIWKNIGKNIDRYKNYPRIVGETGGKDFIWAHSSACYKEVSTALLRGAFEYQGQKCSAASRAYIPESLWKRICPFVVQEVNSMKVGSPRDFSNFINAVIDRKAFERIKGYIERAKESDVANIIVGGRCDDSEGYFIYPTVIETKDPYYESMTNEIFGPILTIYIYKDEQWQENLELINNTSSYALTGAVFGKDRSVIEKATEFLKDAAGNFYINDKPTGAVVGQQPFGGSRASGTNDKAGSSINLLRWVSARTIKETFVPAKDYRYPFLEK